MRRMGYYSATKKNGNLAICNHMDENELSQKCRYCHITYVWDLKKGNRSVNITKSSRLTDTQIKVERGCGGRGDAGGGEKRNRLARIKQATRGQCAAWGHLQDVIKFIHEYHL